MRPNRRDLTASLSAALLLGPVACGRAGDAAARPVQTTGRARADLYNCEGCEAVAETPSAELPAFARLPATSGQTLRLRGKVFLPDGVTPAAGVVLYIHHTNAGGLYADGAPNTVWSRRHGRLRGWVRTSADGRYGFDTIKPAPYLAQTMPAHIHMFVGEPGRPPYYVDDVVFDGEFGVDADYLARQELRGGSGVVRLRTDPDGTLVAVRDLVLERHPA